MTGRPPAWQEAATQHVRVDVAQSSTPARVQLLVATRRYGLTAGLILFALLACLYNVFTPVFESPDELQHTAFVAWVADTGRLPVVTVEDPGPWEQEGTQPPLYYWLTAAVTGWAPHADARHLAEINPHAGGIGDPQRPDNKNRVIHDPLQEGWPYQGTVLFVRLGRLVSTLIALGTLLAIYRLGRVALPGRPGVAVAMAALVAFIPQFLFLSASVNNDNLIVLIASWTLVVLATWLTRSEGSRPRWAQLALLGVLLGLAGLSKLSGMLLWPLAGGVLLWLAWRSRAAGGAWRWLLAAAALVFGLAVALCGWWFVRNLVLYGDLTALSAHVDAIGPRREAPDTFAAAIAEFRGLRYSFWALFGWFNVLVPDVFYWIVDALTVLACAGMGLFVARRVLARRASAAGTRPEPSIPVLLLLFLWLGLAVVGLLRWTLLTPASQGRLLFPALGALALFAVVGLAELLPARLRAPAGGVALAAWIVWAAVSPILFIAPVYAQPVRYRSLADLEVVPSFLNVRYGDCCDLVGYIQPRQPIHAGDRVPLTLIWRARQVIDRDYSVFVHASTINGEIQGQIDTYPAGGRYPTSHWQPGEIISDTVYIPITTTAQGPDLVLFNVGLYELSMGRELPAFSADGQKIRHVFAGEAALEPPQWPQLRPAIQIDALFGQEARLVGADLSQEAALPGDVVTVTLEWRALADIRDDYVGFVHLLSPEGERVAQDDHVPLDGRYPTRLWSRGTVLVDPYRLELPGGLAPGAYSLWAGLYRPVTSDRLQAVRWQTGERWKDDLVYIGTLTIGSR